MAQDQDTSWYDEKKGGVQFNPNHPAVKAAKEVANNLRYAASVPETVNKDAASRIQNGVDCAAEGQARYAGENFRRGVDNGDDYVRENRGDWHNRRADEPGYNCIREDGSTGRPDEGGRDNRSAQQQGSRGNGRGGRG